MRWPFSKRAELKQRVEEARAGVEQAQERLERSREEVVRPLRRSDDHNRFARIIRQSLLNGD